MKRILISSIEVFLLDHDRRAHGSRKEILLRKGKPEEFQYRTQKELADFAREVCDVDPSEKYQLIVRTAKGPIFLNK